MAALNKQRALFGAIALFGILTAVVVTLLLKQTLFKDSQKATLQNQDQDTSDIVNNQSPSPATTLVPSQNLQEGSLGENSTTLSEGATEPAKSNKTGFKISGCPDRGTNYVMYATGTWFEGDKASVEEGVKRYKDACMIPNARIANLDANQIKLVLDVSSEQDTFVIIDFNEHFCVRNNGGDIELWSEFWSRTETQLKNGLFSEEILNHPALIGYYVFDENDKLYGWGNSECKGGDKFLPTIEVYRRLLGDSGKRLFGVTYPCQDYGQECDEGSPGSTQVRVMPWERDHFIAPYTDKLDAIGYFFYPLTHINNQTEQSKFGDPWITYNDAIKETARMAEANGVESFFVTQAYSHAEINDSQRDPTAGYWPTEDQFRRLRQEAEAEGITWLGYWSEGASDPDVFAEHWPDIKNSILE